MATQNKQASALETAAVAAETTVEIAAQTAAVSAPAADLVLAKEGSVPPSAGSWQWVSDGTTQGTGWLRL